MPESTHDDVSLLRAEVSHLNAQLERLIPMVAHRADCGDGGAETSTEERTGRRDLFKMAGVGVLGATVAGLLDASPAGAANGDSVLFGQSNSATATTEVDTTTGDGLHGTTTADGASGVAGIDTSDGGGHGVFGDSANGIGVYGRPTTGVSGLLGSSIAAVVGDSSASVGVVGLSSSSDGISGTSSAHDQSGVTGTSTNIDGGQGVYGLCSSGSGVLGESDSGYGVQAIGGLAPILLLPADSAGHPTSGNHNLGELYVDSNGVFYKCVVAGSPGSWVPMYSVVPLLTPVRVISSPSGAGDTGGLTGPFSPDGTTHTTSVLTGGATGIPDIAVGVVGNLTVSGSGATLNGDGYLTLWPGGASKPSTSSLNSGGDAYATSNGVTVAFGSGADAGKLAFSWQGGGSPPACQVFLDVTAYIL